MKTKLVRPVLVKSKLDSEVGIYQGKVCHSSFGYTVDDWENYQLILISLDSEKIEVGDTGYINIGGGTIGKISYDDKYHTWDLTTSDNIHYPFSTREYIKKVIATQDQLSPDLINQLVSEFNNDGMKDLEIEMHNNLNDPERLYDFEEPYMPNGFVTVVDTVIGKPLEDYIREKHSQDRCMGFIDGYEARKSEENLLYTNEEIFILGDKYDEYCINCFGNLPKSFSDWFNENKKK